MAPEGEGAGLTPVMALPLAHMTVLPWVRGSRLAQRLASGGSRDRRGGGRQMGEPMPVGAPVPVEQAVLETFFSHLGIFSYDKAKDNVEKEREANKNAGSSWLSLLAGLAHLAAAEKAYHSMTFLGQKLGTQTRAAAAGRYIPPCPFCFGAACLGRSPESWAGLEEEGGVGLGLGKKPVRHLPSPAQDLPKVSAGEA